MAATLGAGRDDGRLTAQVAQLIHCLIPQLSLFGKQVIHANG